MLYRIKKVEIPEKEELTFYVAQYRMLRIWLNIRSNNTGSFWKGQETRCVARIEAKERIKRHKNNMIIAKNWWGRYESIVCGVSECSEL